VNVEVDSLDTSISAPLNVLIPNDTVADMNWEFSHALRVSVDSMTGTFSETFTFRVVTPTPVPGPSASLLIPSGAAMLLTLAKLRGAGLGR